MKINIYTPRTIILPVVLYRCENLLFTLREKRMMRVLDKRVLRKTCKPRRDEVTGEWRNLYKEEICDQHSQIFFGWSNQEA